MIAVRRYPQVMYVPHQTAHGRTGSFRQHERLHAVWSDTPQLSRHNAWSNRRRSLPNHARRCDSIGL
jgi:hypothetical protein